MSETGDIKLFQGPEQLWDFGFGLGDLTADEGLETAVFLSLFTNRRAETSDVLPDKQSDLQGWWADDFPVVAGDLVGSRLWLLARETNQATVLQRAQAYAEEALQWLLDDGVASSVVVTVTNPEPRVLFIAVTITRPQQATATSYQYNYNWAAQAAQAA